MKNFQLKISLLGHAYNDVYIFIIPLLLPFFRQEFMFSYFQSGLILAIHVALRSVFSLVFGFLGDRFNHKHLFISFGFALSSILLGSVVLINNFPLTVTVLLLLAIGISTFHPLATALVGERAKPDKRGRDLSLFNAAGTFGVAVMSLIFGWFVQIWGWRITCLIIALPGFALAWGYMQLRINNNKDNSDIKTDKLNNKIIFVIYFISRGLRGLGKWAILSFLPVYMTDHIGLNPGISAWFVSIYLIGELTGSLLISRILDKKNPLKIAIFTSIFTSLFVFAITYYNITSVIGMIILIIGILQGFYYPSQHAWIARVSTNQTRGKLFGVVFFVEGSAGTIAPFVYGWLAEIFGLITAYRLASIPIFVSFLLYLIVNLLVNKQRSLRSNISSAKAQ